jgi:hypothetical protein
VSINDEFFTLVGITSFGILCKLRSQTSQTKQAEQSYEDYNETHSNEFFYGIYTNVANYAEWIKANSDYQGCKNSKL